MTSGKDTSTTLSSWSIEKYSYFVSPLSETAENDWSHFPHRNNLYFVVDRRNASINGMPCVQTWLKVVWSIQVLEELNLTQLLAQNFRTPNSGQSQPALYLLGRTPCLAIKYANMENQQLRRFQIRFKSNQDYDAAKSLLEQNGCSVKMKQASSKDTLDSPSRDYSIAGQRLPGGISAVSSNIQPHIPPLFPSTPKSQFTFPPASMSPARQYTLQPSPTYSGTSFVNSTQCYATPPQSSHSYQPSSYNSSGTLELGGSLPPPRPPPFSPLKKPAVESTTSPGPSRYPWMDLPPLKKPTILGSTLSTIAPQQSTKGEIGSVESISTTYFTDRSSHRSTANPVRPQEYSKRGNQAEVVPMTRTDDFQYPRPQSWNPGTSNTVFERCKSKVPSPGESSSEAVQGAKRKRQIEENDVVDSPTKKIATDEEKNNEQFRHVESLIIDALQDKEFHKLLETVGHVWQRMGFRKVGEDIFDDADVEN